ncbi:MAG: phage tail tape measure protein [Thermoplasmatales archaeon]|nr:phage tail tape measure protein [Thermoplasmatales archaeon]
MNTERLNILISATDEASRVINNITSSFLSLKGVGVAAAVTGIAYLAKSSFEAFANVDRELRKSLSMFGKFSDELYNKAMKVIREIPKQMPYIHVEDAARGLYYLASAGLDAETALKVLPTVAKFAEVTFTDMGKASDTAMTIMKTFLYSADELTIALDKMTKAQQLSLTNMDELQEAFSYAAPAAATLGVSLDDLLTTLDMFADAGIRGSQAGTALRRIMLNLAAGDEKTMEILRELGVKVYDSSGRFRDFSDIMFDLMKALAGTTEQQKIFYLLGLADVRAISALAAVVNRGKSAFEDINKEIENASGTMLEQAIIIETGTAAKYELLKNKIHDAKIAFGAFIYDLIEAGDKVLLFTNPTMFAFKKLVDFLKEKWNEIVAGWGNLWGNAKNIFVGWADYFTGIWKVLISGIKECWNTITISWSNLWEGAKSIFINWAEVFKGFLNSYIISPVISCINAIIDFYNATIAKLPGLPEIERLSLPASTTAAATPITTTSSTTNITMYGVTITTDPREFIQKVLAVAGR